MLLKPQSEIGSQIVVQGRVHGKRREAAAVSSAQGVAAPLVLESFARLRGEADIVLVEGAGSAPRSTCARATSPTWASRAPEAPVVVWAISTAAA